MIPSTQAPLILVVEDDLGLTELIREEIIQRGWVFAHAASGASALAQLRALSPDLVLLDFSLPDMTALQILDQSADRPFPFIVTTGSGDELIAVEMMKQGALDYLVKDAHFLGTLPGAMERALHSVDMERRLAETQTRLQAADESLRKAQKMESLGRMAGGIAHDFNNLFQVIRGNLEAALLKGLDRDEALVSMERALKGLDKATILAHQMLDFSGRGFRRSEILDLNRVVEACQASLLALPGKAQVEFQGAEGLPAIEGDPDQLCQVLAGLVANAREALEATGGTIRITTRLVAPGQAEALPGLWIQPAPSEGPLVCLCVEDAGAGMAKEVLDKAFDPFFSTHRPGRGLGLSAALGLLKGHGAGVRGFTAPGQGTLFQVLFPPAGPELPHQPAAQPFGAQRRALLLVDDDADLLETLGEYLRDSLGYTVLVARDGLEAVEVYARERERIGLVLMDATMPRMTGPDAFRIIQEQDPEARALLCSGFSEEAGTRVAREFGFLEFMKKPFSLKTLQEAILRHMGEPGSGS
jgi:signal transduction histidine kinase